MNISLVLVEKEISESGDIKNSLTTSRNSGLEEDLSGYLIHPSAPGQDGHVGIGWLLGSCQWQSASLLNCSEKKAKKTLETRVWPLSFFSQCPRLDEEQVPQVAGYLFLGGFTYPDPGIPSLQKQPVPGIPSQGSLLQKISFCLLTKLPLSGREAVQTLLPERREKWYESSLDGNNISGMASC